jgi:hypothetical protein
MPMARVANTFTQITAANSMPIFFAVRPREASQTGQKRAECPSPETPRRGKPKGTAPGAKQLLSTS